MLAAASSWIGAAIPTPAKLSGALPAMPPLAAEGAALHPAISRVMPPSPGAAVGTTREGLARFAVGDFRAAEQAFRAVAEVAPHEAMSWSNLALVLVALGELEQAVPVLRRALSLDPTRFEPWVNLAAVLLRLGRAGEAEAACGEALALDPDSADAWQILAITELTAEDFPGAVLAFARAIELGGETATLCVNLGAALMKCGRFDEAAARLGRALELDPGAAGALEVKRMCDFIVAAIAGDLDAARGAYPAGTFGSLPQADRIHRTALLYLDWADRRAAAVLVAEAWVRANPCSVEAAHMRDAALARPAARQPAQFVAEAFDDIAEDFDDRLVRRLGYQGPQTLAALIAPRIAAQGALDVLDLGCGTGLCGSFLRPYARRLTGVDLSAGMLAKAAERGLYDHLEVADLLTLLGGPAQRWDLLIAADTFPYLGDLAPVFEGAAQALRPGGWFAFSTEAVDGDGYLLRGNGRFAHGLGYIQRLAAGGFEIAAHACATLRREAASPVDGDFYLLRRW